MKISYLPNDELRSLDQLANRCLVYLVSITTLCFIAGAFIINMSTFPQIIAIILIGISGSGIAALSSCLDRYSTGFETEDGTPFPEKIKEGAGKFNRRFSRWLIIRPFLGAVIAPVFVWGLSNFSSDPDKYLTTHQTLGFTAFMGGLLAKSIVELIKNLFKNIFKA